MTDSPQVDFFRLQRALAGRYSLERELGRGGMGIVFLGREVALDRPVALKLLPPNLAEQPEARERFLREARVAAKLSHPNIVPIHTVDEVDEFVFFAMAYIEGETLGQRVRERGPRPASETTRVLREVAWALAYAHAQGIVHRDVKPDNILLEEESGRALVTDFGIASAVQSVEADEPGGLRGTAEFMSPEAARGADIGPASDIYSLGVVGFYALAGQLPFTGSTAAAVLGKHIGEPAPRLSSVAPEVPGKLAAVIDRCLAKEPTARFAHGEELAESLGQATGERRDVPVPLRVFIKHPSEASAIGGTASLIGLVYLSIFVATSVPSGYAAIAGWGTFGAGLLLWPAGYSLWRARRVLKAGFDREELVLAFKTELERSREEGAFLYGERPRLWEKGLRLLSGTGFATAAACAVALAVTPGLSEPLFTVFSISLIGGGASGAAALLRHQKRRDLDKSLRAKFWNSRLGRWIFRLAGAGLRRKPALDATGYRPTELAIGMAADRLYEDLPREMRRELRELPTVVRRLEADARTMRRRIETLSELIPQVRGEERESRSLEGAVLPSGGASVAEGRQRLQDELQAARDATEGRLADVVAALERIRLGLLRMHGGAGDVESLTGDLESARGVAGDVERLLEAQREVESLLSRDEKES